MKFSVMSLLCRLGHHRRKGRSVRREAGGWGGVCRHCGITLIKHEGKGWRVARDSELYRSE